MAEYRFLDLVTKVFAGSTPVLRIKSSRNMAILGDNSLYRSRVNSVGIFHSHESTILMTILEEKHHSILTVENDPVLYEDAVACVEHVTQALK